MHTRKLFTIGLLATGLLFTACNDDDDDDFDPVLGPNLSVSELNTNTSGGGDLLIQQGESLKFAWSAEEGAENLDQFAVSITGANPVIPIPTSTEGNDFPYDIDGSDDEQYQDTLIFIQAGTNVGVTNYTFTVTDDDGAQTSVSYDVTVEAPSNLATFDFTWMREGGNPGTGVEQFGLAWNSNTSANAIVKEDEATLFVELTADDWTNIQTQAALTEAIIDANDAGSEVIEYVGVSSEQDGTYDDYLGVLFDGEPYILHIQEGDVETGTVGTTITIMGEYRN